MIRTNRSTITGKRLGMRRGSGTSLRSMRLHQRGNQAPTRRARSQGGVADRNLLSELATRYGIETSYVDMAGKIRKAATETLQAILRLYGIEAESKAELRDAVRTEFIREWRQVLPPVTVCWDQKPCLIEMRLPDQAQRMQAACRLKLEDGTSRTVAWKPERLKSRAAAEIDGQRYVSLQFPIPSLPLGYHRLELQLGHRLHSCLIVSAPSVTYSPPGERHSWGLFLPLYAAHSQRSWGAGNLSDWARLSEWTAAQGGSLLATLPLVATFLEPPFCEPSPYSPASRLFWNEFYLDLEKVPEFALCAPAQKLVQAGAFQRQLASFRADPLVDYPEQMALRRRVLELLARHFFAGTTRREQGFREFLLRHPAVVDYAEFRATCERQGTSWYRWEERMRHRKLQPGDYAQAGKNYHLYAQWVMDEQLDQLADGLNARGQFFYLDLPVGVHPDSYDVWRHRDVFAVGAAAGAPPDPYFPNGQNWGFPPLQPDRLRQREYRYWIEMLRFQMRRAGLLRVDHIMGLHRLFWVPPGMPPSLGAYVRYPAEECYAILSLESHRQSTVLVGENLGTVPPEVNAAMARHHLRETYVLQYEQRPDPKNALRAPPARSVASLNTHDMPPFAAHWAGADIADRVRLGLFPEQGRKQAANRRRQSNEALLEFFAQHDRLERSQGDPDVNAVLRACLEWLASSEAEFVLLNLEDLWDERKWQNVPGTTAGHPNWRRKARLNLEAIFGSKEIEHLLSRISSLRSRATSGGARPVQVRPKQKD